MAEAAEKSGVEAVLDGIGSLSILRQIGIMAGFAASVAIAVSAVLWTMEPDFRPLYTHVNNLDAGEIAAILQQEQIKYRIDTDSGMVMVEANRIHDARMKMAAAGIPSGGAIGYELLDKETSFGTSQFMENARYYRSIEGELAKTVSNLATVRGARVHLAIPKRSVFVGDRRKPSASVFVELYPGRKLDSSQVMAIVYLVASSIPDMEEGDVAVIDQKGRLLSGNDADSEIAKADERLEYIKKVEDKYLGRVNRLLMPLLGDEAFKVEVTADIDFTRIEQSSESYNPDLPALRSEQRVEEERNGSGPGGVPGALTNQPAADGNAPEVAAGGEGGGGATNSNRRSQSTKNFELDRTLSHTRFDTGRVQRLSVAVVVDDLIQMTTDDEGKEVSQKTPWASAEIERLTLLIQDAIGFDASRGDTVSVVNKSFRPIVEVVQQIPEPSLLDDPMIQSLLRQGPAALFAIVVVFLLFRAMSRLATVAPSNEPSLVDDTIDFQSLGGENQVSLTGDTDPLLPGPGSENYEAQLNSVKGIIAEDPKRVAQVVKQWISSES